MLVPNVPEGNITDLEKDTYGAWGKLDIALAIKALASCIGSRKVQKLWQTKKFCSSPC